MIHHTVVWKLRDMDDTERDAIVSRFGLELSHLVGVVPGLVAVTLGVDAGTTESNWDLSLLSVHESHDALDAYQTHPDHVAIGAWFKDAVVSRAAVDSEH
jgi:hypothetical protein